MIRARFTGASLIAAALLSGGPALPAAAQQLVWFKDFNGTVTASGSAGSFAVPNRAIHSVAFDSAGDVFLAAAFHELYVPDCKVVKYAGGSGAVLWEASSWRATPELTGSDCMVAVDASGDAFLGTRAGNEFKVVKYAGATGSKLWEGVTSGAPPASDADSNGHAYSIALDAAGNAVVTGTRGISPDNTVLRTAKFAGGSGALAWQVEEAMQSAGVNVAVDSAGNVLVTGNKGTASAQDFLTVKYAAASGDRIWARTYDGAALLGDNANRIAVDGAGDVVVTGCEAAGPASGACNFRTIKYASANGATVWEKSFAGAAAQDDIATALSLDGSGNAYVSGYSGTGSGFALVTVKYAAADGSVLWQRSTPSSGIPIQGFDSVVDAAGNLVVGGLHGKQANKYAASNGALLFEYLPEVLPNLNDARAVAIDGAGNIVLAGYSVAFGPVVHAEPKVIRYAANGPLGIATWQNAAFNLPVPRSTMPVALVARDNGDVFVTSSFQGRGPTIIDDSEILTLRVRSGDGGTVWSTAESPSGSRTSTAMALDTSDNVLQTGWFGDSPARVLSTRKLNGQTGSSEWSAGYAGVAGSDFEGHAVATNSLRDVVVTGHSTGGAGPEVKTFKYQDNGNPQWQTPDGVPGTGDAIAVDADRNVVVTGTVIDMSLVPAFRTTKHAATNGAVLWQRVSPGGTSKKVAVDAAGNVIVAGTLATTPPAFKIYKLASADGAVLWEASFPLAVNDSGELKDLALSAAGDVVVSGIVQSGSSILARTIRLSATGALRWDRTLFGFAEIANGGLKVDSRDTVILAGTDYLPGAKFAKFGASGEVMIGREFEGPILAMALANDAIYFASSVTTAATGPSMRIWKFNNPPTSTPYPLFFATQSGVQRSSVRTSDTLTPIRYDEPAPVSVTGGAYSIGCTGTFTTAPGFISPGQSICVRHTASTHPATTVETRLEIAGQLSTFTSTTTNVAIAARDLNADGNSDLLFADAAGNIAAWTMNGTGVFDAAGLLPAGSGWSLTHLADFNGDGRDDILLRHTDGRVLMWIMNGLAPATQTLLQPAASGWRVTHVADMNGDGYADILWEHIDGTVAVWTMSGDTLTDATVFQPAGSGWHITHMADLNGDGRADILWQHTDGTTVAWLMNGLTYLSSAGFTPAGSGWSITHTGDVNGDGKADLVFRKSDGAVMLWVMDGTSLLNFAALQNAGTPWRIDLVGDLDGDGKADLVWRNTSDGSTYATLMNGTATSSAGYLMGGNSGWTATHLLDLNGDGKADILWRYSDGTIAAWLMNGLGPIGAAGFIGPSTWQVVPPQ